MAYNRRTFGKSSCQLPLRIVQHRIDRDRVSRHATAVLRDLRQRGFDAYLVGGCVRDLLLGRTPKDFDVATSATPEDVATVFPRVRLIGRRFRIAHVRMQREIIEVSTFRRALDGEEKQPNGSRVEQAHLSHNGIILRDNAYGTIDEDAFRRDFTVNALYYDPIADEVLDYCDGMADIAAGTLRTIGEPLRRMREDPVRILRAVRFAAKLGLDLHPDSEAAIAPTRQMLTAIPPARLFDEFAKMFLNGHGECAFDLLSRYGLAEILFPLLDRPMIRQALASTDQRVAENKPVTEGFLVAALLWREYQQRIKGLNARPNAEDRDEAACAVLAAQRRTIAVPRRHGYFVRDVWALQPILERRTASGIAHALAHRRFRAAYDFLLLRVEAGEVAAELGDWWTKAQTGEVEAPPPAESPAEGTRRRRRRRRRGGRASRAPARPGDARTTDNGVAVLAAPAGAPPR